MAPILWNETTAAHLFRRAAFGGTSAQITKAVADGMNATVDGLLNYETVPTTDLDARIAGLALDLTTFNGISRWWITRILFSPRPLEERMVLFWHDHLATAISKVGEADAMLAQNQLFRRMALGRFTDLTVEVSKDIAMLLWLDNYTNKKSRPNENYGRELLELFTLGQGFYSELDVYSASKAFTGWTFRRINGARQFFFADNDHDHGQKDFLGRVGDWNGEDIIRIACGEFAHGRLIARKLFSWFAFDDPDTEVVDRFARVYLDSGTNVKALVEAILKSEEMYSEKAMWSRVGSPVDHALIPVKLLGIDGEAVSRQVINVMAAEGQTLFNPPDVAGWDGGLAWISAGSLLTRMNWALTLSTSFDPVPFVQGETITTPAQMVDVFLRKLGPLMVSAATRDELVKYVSANGQMPTGSALTIKQRGLVHMILSLPEWQMY